MRALAIFLVAACGSSTPAADRPGPPGTWTCKQIVESCDSMCRTGMCLQACSRQGDPNGGSLHAALIQCAAANRCYDDACTRALCPSQVDACISDTNLTNVAQTSGPVPPGPLETPRSEPPPTAPVPVDDAPAPKLATEALVGTWTYGAKLDATHPAGNGGWMVLDRDGRFERMINTETRAGSCKLENSTHAVGTWKLDGAALALSVKQAKTAVRDSCKPANPAERDAAASDERRAVRMQSATELAITDDAGELQSYVKKTK